MMNSYAMRISLALVVMLVACGAFASETKGRKKMIEKDIVKTSAGDLKITFIGHGTLMFTFGGKVIHVDPVSAEAD